MYGRAFIVAKAPCACVGDTCMYNVWVYTSVHEYVCSTSYKLLTSM